MQYFVVSKVGEAWYAIGKATDAKNCTCNFHKEVEILPERYETEEKALQIMEQYNSDLQTVKNLFIRASVGFL